MILAVVGSGGKTTLIKKCAGHYMKQGLKVFVTTSTHMAAEKDALFTDDAGLIIGELEKKRYVMAGMREKEKMRALPETVYKKVCTHADVVLIEADGSNRKPIKYPAEYEPVIYDNVDKIIVVCGLWAIGMRAGDAAHRIGLVKKCLDIEDDTIITAGHIQKLVSEGYVKPLRKKYPDKEIEIYPSHDGSLQQRSIAEKIILGGFI